ncbi:MAG: YfhO family protein [Ardenticatenaceae bacterium]|nr:YfhO family protein [Ardenticatenaceae bacterium]MCB9445372.1 YfhO family protein [Ardenticatenaceae bacterium]
MLAILFLIALPPLIFWSLWAPSPDDRFVFTGDILVGAYPTRVFVHRLLTSGQTPLWNPYQLGGMPLMGDIQVAVYYLPNLILDFLYWNSDIPYTAFEGLVVAHYAIAGALMFLYLRNLRLPVIPALIGAIAFEFNGFFVGHRGHYSMFSVVVWVPGVLWAIDSLRHSATWQRRIMWVAAGAFLLSQMVMGGHPQLTFYSGLFVAAYFLFQWIGDVRDLPSVWRKGWQAVVGHTAVATPISFAITSLLALGIAAITLLPMVELLGRSLRSEPTYVFSSQYPLMPRNLITLLIPEFLNWSGTEFRIYAGILTLVLVFVAWMLPDNKHREAGFFTGALIVVTIMAFGGFTSLHGLLYRYIPGFSSVRVSARLFYLANISLAVLAAIGAARLLADLTSAQKERLLRFVRGSVWPLGFLGLLVIVFYVVLIWNYRPVEDDFYFYETLFVKYEGLEDRYLFFTQLMNAVWVFLTFLGGSLLLVWARAADRVQKQVVALTAVALITIDMSTFTPQHDAARAPDFESIGMTGFDIRTLEWWAMNDRDELIADLADLPAYQRIDNGEEVLPDNYSQTWRLNFATGYNVLDLQERFEILNQWPNLTPNLSRDLMNVSHIVTAPDNPDAPEEGAVLILENSQGKIWQRAAVPDYAHFSTSIRPAGTSQTINGILWHTGERPFQQPALAAEDEPLDDVLAAYWPELIQPDLYTIGSSVPSPVAISIIAGGGAKYSAIIIDGETVTPEQRGLIHAFIDPQSGDLLESGSYDTYISERQSNRLATAVQALPAGTIVALATYDEGTNAATPELQNALAAIGSTVNLKSNWGQSIAIIGIKDGQPGSALERIDAAYATLDIGPGAVQPVETAQFQSSIVKYAQDEIIMLVENDAAGLLTISETVYPGWQAAVDGQPVPILRSNGLFRSVILPASQPGVPHEVVFTYAPTSVTVGKLVSGGTAVLTFLLLITSLLLGPILVLRRRILSQPAANEPEPTPAGQLGQGD